MRFGESERYIAALFEPGSRFSFKGKAYEVELSGKPTTKQGEPKTDVYVRSLEIESGQVLVFKVSFKQHNADFLENKMTAERAEQIFGSKWKKVISGFTKQMETTFLDKPLIFKSNYKSTRAGSITLGWKFELLNKPGGDLSDSIRLRPEEVVEVYAGRKLADSKRNASVNGMTIPESGVANCIIHADIADITSVQDAVRNIVGIESFAQLHPSIYFACKALNYRTSKGKYDGNRPLSVYVDWHLLNGRLTPSVQFDQPLVIRGDQVAHALKECLAQLDITSTEEMTCHNVSPMDVVYG